MYNINETWLDNLKKGPNIKNNIVYKSNNIKPKLKFLNKYMINSPIGVASGPLLDSKWIKVASDLKFDVLTYKTIRSYAHLGHPLPNVVKLKNGGYTNSFGMPSMDKKYLRKDIPEAYEYIKNKGQVLIISVTGDNFEDFVNTAKFAVYECGATILELNLSCPNISESYVSLYQTPAKIYELVNKIKQECNVPIIIKVGVYDDINIQAYSILGAYDGGASAIAGINGIQQKVDVLGKDRPVSGICGPPLLPTSLKFVSDARNIIRSYKLKNFELIGVGGVSEVKHINSMIEKGANIVMCATAFINGNHDLAIKYNSSF